MPRSTLLGGSWATHAFRGVQIKPYQKGVYLISCSTHRWICWLLDPGIDTPTGVRLCALAESTKTVTNRYAGHLGGTHDDRRTDHDTGKRDCVRVCVRVSVCMRMCLCMYIYIYMRMCVCLRMCVCMYAYVHARARVCVCVYVCVCARTRMGMYVCMQRMYVRMHERTCAFVIRACIEQIHTCPHKHTHTHTRIQHSYRPAGEHSFYLY